MVWKRYRLISHISAQYFNNFFRLYEIRRRRGGKRQQEGAREVELKEGRPRQSRPRTRRRVGGGKMTTGPMRRILTKEEKVEGARQEKEEKEALLEKLSWFGNLCRLWRKSSGAMEV